MQQQVVQSHSNHLLST
uniref:Uncharacterized protein n=1 Tax=Arundo donax TaxID=35708 RepID=A0A0A8Y3L6_ARUDO